VADRDRARRLAPTVTPCAKNTLAAAVGFQKADVFPVEIDFYLADFSRGSVMQHLIRHTALSLALATASAVGISLPAQAAQQQKTDNRAYDIEAGQLDQVLTRFAEQSGLRLMVVSEWVAGQQSQGLKGNYPVQQGLDRLLLNSGLVARLSDDVILIEKAPVQGGAVELGATTIQGQGMGEMTENSGSYTTGLTSIGSKTPTSLRQTPQSVSVVTAKVIEEKRMTDLAEAMKTTPGITVTNNNFRLSDFSSRGFNIENIQIDGAAPMALGTTSGSFYSNKSYDLVEYDHVEVLRGASGLFGGTGDPGGMINLVRKRPLDAYQLKIDVSAGSWDNYRTQMDVTGPLGFDGKLRGRMVAAYTDRQYMADDRALEKPIFYGVLEADITDDTRLTLGGRSERIHETGSGTGLPRYLDGRDLGLSRSASLTQNWAYLDGRSQEIFGKIDHEFNENWKGNVSYTQTLDSGFSKSAFSFGAVDPATMTGPNTGGSNNKYRSDQKLFDVNLAGKFEAMGLQHELLVGMDHQKITSSWAGTAQATGSGVPIDVFNPAPWPQPDTDKDFFHRFSPNTQVQYGLYSTLRLQLAAPLHLIVGARAQRYKFDQLYRSRDKGVWGTDSDVSVREPTKVVPYGGIVYDLTDEWSTYASYSEIFKPQQTKLMGPYPGSPIESMTGKTYETGVKGELWGGAVNTSFALYYTSRKNEAVLDPRYEASSVLHGGNCCYLPQGEVTSKGVDMEFTGEVLPDWNVLAGYTYNHNRNRTQAKVFSSVTPKHQVKLWSTYRLPGVFNDLKVGGGVNLQSATDVSGTTWFAPQKRYYDFKYSQSGYAVWDAMAEYQLDENWSVLYNINNLFDKHYYSKLGTPSSGNWYGDERNHMLTLRGTFW
jgi:outer membrane receptor for ferric coprogen and ferric-rhodotorulic acid